MIGLSSSRSKMFIVRIDFSLIHRLVILQVAHSLPIMCRPRQGVYSHFHEGSERMNHLPSGRDLRVTRQYHS
jgi:hypothetical protein